MANLVCFNALDGVGVPCEQLTPITGLRQIVLARPGFTFADSQAFATFSNWETGIINGDLFVVPNIQNQESIAVEDGEWQGDFGDLKHLYDGMKGLMLMLTLTLDQHQILKNYTGKNFELFKIDRNNNIIGVVQDDGKIRGFELNYFRVGNQTEPAPDAPPFTPVRYQELDPGEYNSKGCYVNPVFRAKNIKPLTKVTVTAGTITTNAFQATVAYVPSAKFDTDGSALSIPLTGLDETSFKVIDQTGAINVLASVVESSVTPGTYTVTGTTLTSGTVEIVPVSGALYESAQVTLS